MAIGAVEMATIARSQDYVNMKANEDNKGMIDQTHFGQTFTKEIETRNRQVTEGKKAEQQQKKYDAKEKGNGQYFRQDGQNEGKKRKNPEDRGKNPPIGRGGFDVKI